MLGKTRLLDDIVVEILSRLPPESLTRFKCVHKSWYILTEDSKFVAMHLRNHVSNQILLVGDQSWYVPRDDGEDYDYTDMEMRFMISMLRCDGEDFSLAEKDVDITGGMSHLSISVSCQYNGIVCFYDFYESVIIANPGIKQFRFLPESCIPPSEPGCLYKSIVFALGLGFDIRANDYKVVRILDSTTTVEIPVRYYGVEVYSLRSNSWKQIESIPIRLYRHLENVLSCYWSGAYYWPASKTSVPATRGILSFNFSDEVFQFTSIPEVVSSTMNNDNHNYGITELNGAQALVSYGYENGDWSFDIWDMDSYGVHGAWTKLLSSGSFKIDEHITYNPAYEPLRVYKVLGVFKKELLLLLTTRQVVSYSFLTNKMKILLSGEIEIIYKDGTCYSGGLVSVNKIYDSNC